MSISSMYKNTATELFLSYKAMLKKIYVHQNIHQSLIPLYLIHKKQTWEKNVHISDPEDVYKRQGIGPATWNL